MLDQASRLPFASSAAAPALTLGCAPPVSAGVGDGDTGPTRRGLRAPGVGVRLAKWVLEYSPSNKRIRYFVSSGLCEAQAFGLPTNSAEEANV